MTQNHFSKSTNIVCYMRTLPRILYLFVYFSGFSEIHTSEDFNSAPGEFFIFVFLFLFFCLSGS